MALGKLKVRRIEVNGRLRPGVYAKDVILHIICTLGVNGGTGYAYEYGGEVFDRFSMEERMTVCNMSIEGGARAGYVNPDQTTVDYLKGRPYAPKGPAWDAAVARWKAVASDPGCRYDDVVRINAADIAPTVTWGINPGQGIPITGTVPDPAKAKGADEKASIEEALAYMKLKPGAPIKGTRIDVAFLGSCTNGRLSDFQEVARVLKGRRVAPGVKAIAVPGSQGGRPALRRARDRPGLPRRRLRMARRRVLDVPGHESGQARRGPGLRQLVQPQFQGPPGQSDRPHPAHEPAYGRRRGRLRLGGRRPRGFRRRLQLEPPNRHASGKDHPPQGPGRQRPRKRHRHRPDHPRALS